MLLCIVLIGIFIEITLICVQSSSSRKYKTVKSQIYYTARKYRENKVRTGGKKPLQTETSDDIPTSSCANGAAGTQCDFNNMSLDFNDRKTLCGL